MKKPKIVIGIDPDVEASGMGVVRVGPGGVEVSMSRYAFPEIAYAAMAEVTGHCATHPSYAEAVIVVEAGWLNGGNWHLNGRDNARQASTKGHSTGRNHQVGMDICELLRYLGTPVQPVAPLIKCWQGPQRKITTRELNDIVVAGGVAGGLPTARCNQEERDALLLAWHYANLPIRLKPLRKS